LRHGVFRCEFVPLLAGSYVSAASGAGIQLEPGVAHPLSDGDRLLLGWTVITFEQPQD
jgi:hypothetical protein